MKPISTASPAIWKERYENLRGHVVERRQSLGADPLDLLLLCRQGLASWMRGWCEVTVPTPCFPLSPSALPSPLTPLWQQQLTGLLAQMTAQHLPTTSGI
jgi:hypothetical protein